MQTLFVASEHTHMASAILLILSQLAYFIIAKEQNFIKFSIKLGNLLLMQNIIIGIVLFTGLLMMAVTKFEVWNIAIGAMIFVMIGVIVHQILINKKRKPIKSDEVVAQQVYKKWVAKVYGAEVVAEIVVILLAFLV